MCRLGYLSDRVSKFLLMVIGGVIISVAVLFFQWSRGFWDMFWINIAFGIGGGISTPALMALAVMKGTRAGAMGSVMSLMTMAHSLGMLAGSLLAGWMMDVLQLRSVFPLGALLMGLRHRPDDCSLLQDQAGAAMIQKLDKRVKGHDNTVLFEKG